MAQAEENIVAVLTDNFDDIEIRIQRERRIWLAAPREIFIELMTFIHDELDFAHLSTMTGMDTGTTYELVYHLAHDDGIVLTARTSAPHDDPVFDTVTDIYKGGVLYELEARNLLGLTIHGIPEDIRYPLPDSWPEGEYPLRKDWVNPFDVPGSEDASEGSE